MATEAVEAVASDPPRSALAERRHMGLNVAVPRPSKDAGRAESFRKLRDGESVYALYDVAQEAYQTVDNRGVYPCTCKADGKERVLKIRRKKKGGADRVFVEMLGTLMSMPAHANLLTFTELLEDDMNFYMVMDKCNSGELFQLLLTEAEISERECKRLMREILSGVGVLHSNGLVHRDIKPENLLLHREDETSPKSPKSVKLIDFDTSNPWEPGSPKSKHIVGTHGYIAPEAYRGDYTPKSDLWSVGVIFYVLMTGDMPYRNSLFDEANGVSGSVGHGIEKMYDRLKAESIDWDCQPWPQFPLARDLCQRLLAFDPEERTASAADALAHEWLAGRKA